MKNSGPNTQAWFARLLAMLPALAVPASVQANADALPAALEIGLTPESIVLAGIEEDLPAIALRINDAATTRAQMASHRSAIDSLMSEVTSTHQQLAVSADEDAETLILELESLMASLVAEREALEVARASLRSIAYEGLPSTSLEAMERWRASSNRQVPGSFRVLTRTPDQWTALEAAIRAERIATAENLELDPEYQQLLTTTRDLPSVNLARAQLLVMLPSTTSQFLQVLVP